jgi:hypothetical protein
VDRMERPVFKNAIQPLGGSDQGAPLSTILAWTELYGLTALLPTHAAAQLTRALGANGWGPALRIQARLEVAADAWTSAIATAPHSDCQHVFLTENVACASCRSQSFLSKELYSNPFDR